MADPISGPINGLTDEERADTTSPSLAQTTTGESLEATATQAWHDLPLQSMSRSNLRTMGQTAFDPDAPIQPGMGLEFDQGAATPPEDANAQAKQAGADLTPFSHPVGQDTLKSMIEDNLAKQKSQDVIQRSAAGIIASPARFAVGALVSLADPINDMAMMVPGLPEAWAARAIESAGGGILARTAVRAGAGAVQGAAGMAALQPLQAVQASQDHEDYSWGEALRQVMFGAALGAGGGALHGVLSRSPETVDATMKAALARVMTDDPRGVDVGAILDRGEADASTAPPPAKTGPELALAELDARQAPDTDYRDMLSTSTKKELAPGETWRDRAVSYVESTRPEPSRGPDAYSLQETSTKAYQSGSMHTFDVTGPDGSVVAKVDAHYDTATKALTIDNIIPTTYDPEGPNGGIEQQANALGTRAMMGLRAQLQQRFPEAETIGGNRVYGANPDRDLTMKLKAQQSAAKAAARAMDTTDPELVRTSRANAATIEQAPKLEGVVSKDTTEASQMLADKKAEYDSHVAAGRIVESPTLADEGKAETEFGEGAKAYAATCGFGA